MMENLHSFHVNVATMSGDQMFCSVSMVNGIGHLHHVELFLNSAARDVTFNKLTAAIVN